MLENVMKFIFATIPVAILMRLLYSKGKGFMLPLKGVKWSFIWGMLITIVIGICITPIKPESRTVFNILWTSAFPEELIKFITMLILINRYNCTSKIDTLVVCGSVGLGFAYLENIMYIIPHDSYWVMLSIMRALSSIPAHFSYAIFMGYFIYRAFNKILTPKQKLFSLSIAFILPTLIHWFKNALIKLTEGTLEKIAMYIPIILLIIAFKIIQKARLEAIEGQ